MTSSDSGLRSLRQYEVRASFVATPEQAEQLRKTLETAAAVFLDPTEDNASALFEMGALAVVGVAQRA